MSAPAAASGAGARAVMHNPLSRFVREPLVHFLAIGASLFALYALVSPDAGDPGADALATIVVTPEQVTRLRGEFERVWLRPPSRQETAGLIENHVREEVLYREALRLGLDRGDAIVRRRLNQKMEFLASSGAELLEPSEAELDAFLSRHAERFRTPGRIAFRQVFLGEAPPPEDVESARLALRRLPAHAQPVGIGRATLLPHAVGPAAEPEVRSQFGPAFADSVFGLEPGGWRGPVRSGFGWHLVHVDRVVPGRAPALDEIREKVLHRWRSERADALRESWYQDLRRRYRVETRGGEPS